ncbi:MAG: hypothetical protein PHU25_13730 [Deltaproteobacteria bacterium]|nr:hypothetical protein [Deltaproteobacteria bacterium]
MNDRLHHVARPSAALAALAAFACLAISPARARADEFDQFINAKNAYEAGEYATAITRFEDLLSSGVKNPALLLECHKLVGISYLFAGDRTKAEAHFYELLTLSPTFLLDPMIYPMEVVDVFTEVKRKNNERIETLARAQAADDEKRRAEETKRRAAEVERLKRNVYVERSRTERSLLVAFLPLGVGQFQNGDKVKGALFLSGELLLGAGALTTFILHESLRPRGTQPVDSASERESYEKVEAGYRIANQACLVALGVVAITGVIESVYSFKRETVTWDTVDEKDVPRKLRPGRSSAAIAPFASERAAGLALIGEF